MKYKYDFGIKSKWGSYSHRQLELTDRQFEAYYDKVVESGGKVIGIIKTEL